MKLMQSMLFHSERFKIQFPANCACRFFILGAMVALLASSASACSCGGGGGPACQEAWSQWVSAIFLGRVTKIETGFSEKITPDSTIVLSMKRVTIQIEEGYRGVSGATADVLTASDEGACGYSFKSGERYLIFAYGDVKALHVSMCSATRPAQWAEEDIAYMRSLPTRDETARVYGNFKRYTFDPKFVPNFQPSIMDHYRPPEEEYRAMAPMTGSVVKVKATDGSHEALVDKDGKWEVSGLPAGPYSIAVDLPENLILDRDLGLKGELAPKGCSRVFMRTRSNGHLRGHIRIDPPLSSYYLSHVGIFRADELRIDLLRPFGEMFPKPNGDFDLGPLPPGRYYLAVLLDNKNLDVAAVFYPGEANLAKASVIELGDGETKSDLDFSIDHPKFHSRPSCCEFVIRNPNKK